MLTKAISLLKENEKSEVEYLFSEYQAESFTPEEILKIEINLKRGLRILLENSLQSGSLGLNLYLKSFQINYLNIFNEHLWKKCI